MGKFTNIKELVDNDLWEWYCPDHRGILVNKSSVFRYECAIDRTTLDTNFDGSNRLKIEIRQFVEQNLPDTVIMDFMSLSYFYDPKINHQPYSSYSGYQVNHGYYRFFFESEASQVMFALKFSEHIVTKYRWKESHIPSGKGPNQVWTPDTDGKWR